MQIITYDMYRESKVLQDVDVPQVMGAGLTRASWNRTSSKNPSARRKEKNRTRDSEQNIGGNVTRVI